jgi:hypothetical protein
MRRIDDTILKAAASNFIKQIMAERPAVALAAHILDDTDRAHLVVEVPVYSDGPRGALLVLDTHHEERQLVLHPQLFEAEEPIWGRPTREAAAAKAERAAERQRLIDEMRIEPPDLVDCDVGSRRSPRSDTHQRPGKRKAPD